PRQPLKVKQANTAANKAFTAPVRRTLRERQMPRELKTRRCLCLAEPAEARAQSSYRAPAKPVAVTKHQSPAQAAVLRCLPDPASPTRFWPSVLHAHLPFSCQRLPPKKQVEAQHLRLSRATHRFASWPGHFPPIPAADGSLRCSR